LAHHADGDLYAVGVVVMQVALGNVERSSQLLRRLGDRDHFGAHLHAVQPRHALIEGVPGVAIVGEFGDDAPLAIGLAPGLMEHRAALDCGEEGAAVAAHAQLQHCRRAFEQIDEGPIDRLAEGHDNVIGRIEFKPALEVPPGLDLAAANQR
jgi:hypothetical protein